MTDRNIEWRVTRPVIAACIALAAFLGGAGEAAAQEPATDSLRQEMARLQAQLDSLETLVQRLIEEGARPAVVQGEQEEADDPLAAIRAAAAETVAEGEAQADTAGTPEAEDRQFIGRQRTQQALNPELTLTGDIFAFVDTDDVNDQNFVPREFEASIQSNLDPYSRGVVFISHEVPGGEILPFGEVGHEEDEGEHEGEEEEGEEAHEAGVHLEEGYVQWTGGPGGLGLTVGRFFQQFGQLNRWHRHALPAQMLPLPYLAFFGEEGLGQTGVSAHWLLPTRGGGGAYDVWIELTRSSNEVLFGESREISALTHLNGFWDLSRSTYFEVGLTGLIGPGRGELGGRDTWVTGANFTLNWRPPATGRYREFTLRGGAVLGRVGLPEIDQGKAFGAFGIAELRLSQRWIIGGRYEYTEDPLDPDRSAWLAAPSLTWWQSEWVRLRAEFDILNRPEGNLNLLTIQTTFSMGPHRHEAY